jgi:hypothetical protein
MAYRLHTRLTVSAATYANAYFSNQAHLHERQGNDWTVVHHDRAHALVLAHGYRIAAHNALQLRQDLEAQNRLRKRPQPDRSPATPLPAAAPLVPYSKRRRNPTTHRRR